MNEEGQYSEEIELSYALQVIEKLEEFEQITAQSMKSIILSLEEDEDFDNS